MMATFSAKDGPPMFPDWLSPARPAVPPESDAARRLAAGVLQLCTLCEELLALVAAQDAAARPQVCTIPERLEAVRACASAVQRHEGGADTDPDDPYSLPALSRWVWRED